MESGEPKLYVDRPSLLREIVDFLFTTPLEKAVRSLARDYFAAFGPYEIERKGIEIELQSTYCIVHFYETGAIGSYIEPRDKSYGNQVIDEVSFPGANSPLARGRLRREVERQMKLIVEKFRPALQGDFSGWSEDENGQNG